MRNCKTANLLDRGISVAIDEGSEYGGKAGIIQKAADGHVDLPAKERRFVNAVYARRTAGVDFTLPETDLHRPYVDEVLADLPIRTAGRTPTETEGDQVS